MLSRMLQMHGYSACREALVLLQDHYNSSGKYESIEDFIVKLNQVLTFDVNAGTSIIDPDLAHSAIKKLRIDLNTQQVNSDENNPIELDQSSQSNSNELPEHLDIKIKNVSYEHLFEDKKAILDGGDRVFNPHFVEKQSNEYNILYNFLFRRLSSLPIFQDNFKLTKLSTLTGSTQPSIRCICFGLLIKDISKIDGYMLIDSSGRVPVRITPDTTFRNKLAYTNCIVLIEGVYVNPDDILFAANIGLPPILLDPIQDKALACRNENIVIILRELFMDEDETYRAVDVLFSGYNSIDQPPQLFILIGDFTRSLYKPEEYRVHFKKLIRIIRACDNLKQSHFVFVPGDKDSAVMVEGQQKPHTKMPKPPMTKEQVPLNLFQLSDFNNVHLATNPTHIYFGERQITVVAHSYIKELKKNLLHDLSDHREELLETVKQIILSNGHLSAGISKTHHSSMNLWHRPDLLLLADTEAFGNKYDYNSPKPNDTSFATVPSFSRQYNQFKVYYIKSGEIEDSQVSSDMYQGNDNEQVVDLVEDEPVSELK